MMVVHRGHEITVTRERSLGGDMLLYYSVFRQSDGYECLSAFEDSAETVRAMIGYMRHRIDEELKEDDPWCEKEGLAWMCDPTDAGSDDVAGEGQNA